MASEPSPSPDVAAPAFGDALARRVRPRQRTGRTMATGTTTSVGASGGHVRRRARDVQHATVGVRGRTAAPTSTTSPCGRRSTTGRGPTMPRVTPAVATMAARSTWLPAPTSWDAGSDAAAAAADTGASRRRRAPGPADRRHRPRRHRSGSRDQSGGDRRRAAGDARLDPRSDAPRTPAHARAATRSGGSAAMRSGTTTASGTDGRR